VLAAVHIDEWHPLWGPTHLAVWEGLWRVPPSVAANVARQTLLGELGGVTTDLTRQRQAIAPKVTILHAPEVLVFSAVLCATRPAPVDGRPSHSVAPTMYAVSAVAPGHLLQALHPVIGLLQDRLRWLGLLLHAWLSVTDAIEDVVAAVHPEVDRLLGHFAVWAAPPHRTPSYHIGETVFGIVSPSDAEKVLLGRALTAFLMAEASAVVRADRPEQALLWMRTLLLLTDPKDHTLVRLPDTLAAPSVPGLFVPGLRLQYLGPGSGEFDGELVYDPKPVAVLNVGAGSVTVGLPPNVHDCLRTTYFEGQLARVDGRDRGPAASMERLKQTPQAAVAPLVAQLLDWCFGQPVPLREGLIQAWRGCLLALAEGVVGFVAAQLEHTTPVAAGVLDAVKAGGDHLSADAQTQLWDGLDLESPHDQRIVLAVAEVMQPGISPRVLGPWDMAGSLASILHGLEAF